MKIGFIGAGKVGFTLGRYFKEHGADVTGYFSRSKRSAEDAAKFTDTKTYDSIADIVDNNELLFLTVPDDAIKPLWESIKTIEISDKLICHCSGAMSSEVFEEIEKTGAYGYSLHPFFAISSRTSSYETLSQAFFTVEGDEKHIAFLADFIIRMGNPVHKISAKQKVKYHAAAVFLSNHVTALAHSGCKLLADCGFDDNMVSMALNTLFLAQSKVIAEKGVVNALTGPVERNDMETVKKHLECLCGSERMLYAYLSEQLVEIAKKKHDEKNYSDMESLLRGIMEK